MTDALLEIALLSGIAVVQKWPLEPPTDEMLLVAIRERLVHGLSKVMIETAEAGSVLDQLEDILKKPGRTDPSMADVIDVLDSLFRDYGCDCPLDDGTYERAEAILKWAGREVK